MRNKSFLTTYVSNETISRDDTTSVGLKEQN